MCKGKIIIPAAKIVPDELQKLGKMPGIIYPVNQKIVFEYLYEQYEKICSSMDIICYEEVDKVQKRLCNYLGKKVHIKLLPELKDLGHTIHFALDRVYEPVIINFSDTILMDTRVCMERDTIYYHKDFVSEAWTYFDEENGVITNIYDKEITHAHTKKKLIIGVFNIVHPQFFRICLENAFCKDNLKMNTFYYALMLYSQKYPLKAIATDNWFDVGHADTYFNSNIAVKTRDFNHISIDQDRGILKKTSEDKEKFIGEIKWYLKLPKTLEYMTPRIFDYSTLYESPYISMEYYAYHTIHELFLFGDLTYQQWVNIFNRIYFVYRDFKQYKMKDGNIVHALNDIYLVKTLQRLDKIKSNKRLCCFFDRPIKINGTVYQSLAVISKKLEQVIPELLYNIEEFNIIHGDFCFTNIMIDNNFSFIKVVDPRGKFGIYDIYGDSRYDLAKLLHSVDGKYDFIIKDLFNVKYDLKNSAIEYSIQGGNCNFDICDIFMEVFVYEIEKHLKEIELIEALLFLSMIPLHNENLNHQVVMLGTGIEILSRVIDITLNGGKGNV